MVAALGILGALGKAVGVSKAFHLIVVVPTPVYLFVHSRKGKGLSWANVALGSVYGVGFRDKENPDRHGAESHAHRTKFHFHFIYLKGTIRTQCQCVSADAVRGILRQKFLAVLFYGYGNNLAIGFPFLEIDLQLAAYLHFPADAINIISVKPSCDLPFVTGKLLPDCYSTVCRHSKAGKQQCDEQILNLPA